MKQRKLDYEKEHYRGTIKQIMKVRGLRTISLNNYNAWKGVVGDATNGIHSVKLDLQDGYVNVYSYGETKKGKPVCGEALTDVSCDKYRSVYEQVMAIVADEKRIPYRVRRNILVRMSR